MPFFHGTPEARLARSDSKDPATTCKGITASGRPCRRPLAASAQSTPSKSPRNKSGVIAILPDAGISDTDLVPAAFFCFQHQDQAQSLDDGSPRARTKVIDLKHTARIDTLADRLGVLDVRGERDDTAGASYGQKVVKRDTLPPNWQKVPGSFIAVPKEASALALSPTTSRTSRPRPLGEPGLFLSLLGCVKVSEPFDLPPPRRRDSEVVYTASASRVSRKSVRKPTMSSSEDSPVSSTENPSSPKVQRKPQVDTAEPRTTRRPPLGRDPSSQTQHLLSLIPRTLSPQITSLLLTELSKPLSPFDRDAFGWIYIYWITPEEVGTPDEATATSLLSSSPRSSKTSHRPSDTIRPYTTGHRNSGAASTPQTILLKIGHTKNVQRRLNQWKRQCRSNLSLVRYYPHQPSSSPSAMPRKAPYVQRIERLIHLELSEKKIKQACQCGHEHREWFEVDASRGAVRAVDEVAQRWVAWAEEKASSSD